MHKVENAATDAILLQVEIEEIFIGRVFPGWTMLQMKKAESPDALRAASIILLPYVSSCRRILAAGAKDDGPSKPALGTDEISVTGVFRFELSKMAGRHVE